ncbi:MAG: ABC transporter ATP-binding protein [Coriobacteriia bacterium]|nr:ABC transporter ATP-binding protein [Coriobacteriia bacterium]
MAFIKLIDVVKEYRSGDVPIRALDSISFEIDQGELAVVVGPSGAGKSTVLNILGGMDTADSGQVWVGDKDIVSLNRKSLTDYRRNDVGFVFQFYNLIPNLTALENVELASQICRDHRDALETLELVGLGERRNHFPSQLSGGEQQRVAIARALAKNPLMLLCDEPTGALDFNTGRVVLRLLENASRELNITVIIVTHNLALTAMADRVIRMGNGQVQSLDINSEPISIESIGW